MNIAMNPMKKYLVKVKYLVKLDGKTFLDLVIVPYI